MTGNGLADTHCGFVGVRSLSAKPSVPRMPKRLLSTEAV
jgi:hypothetical protein